MTRTIALISLLAAACGTSDVSLGGPGTIVRVEPEPAGANCANGGLKILTGLDDDGDRFLDDEEIDSVQFVCNGESPVQCEGGTIIAETVAITDPAEFDQLEGVHCIDGDLLITGLDVEHIPDLPDLGIVTGGIVVAGNPALLDLDGLGAMRRVGGTYLIQANEALEDLVGLGMIQTARSIAVVGNNALTALDGLENLVSFSGGIRVSNNASLTSLRGLDRLEECSGTITVAQNRELIDLSLGSLRTVTVLDVISNTSLPALSLPALDRIEVRMTVGSNPAMTDASMPQLTTVGDGLRFEDNAALTRVSAPILVTTNGMGLDGDVALSNLDMPNLIFITGRLQLHDLPALTQIRLPALSTIGSDLIVNGVQIQNFSSMSSLSSVGGNLVIQANSNMANFTGLGQLTLVAGDMTVTGNAGLSSMAGLEGMTEVGGALTITNNPILPTSQAQQFANRISVGSTTTISGNQ
jgi:hypothetical protein